MALIKLDVFFQKISTSQVERVSRRGVGFKPVIAFNISSMPEIIEDGKTGYLIKFPDIDEFIKKIKDYGYLVKLDTNGSFPDRLEKVIKDGTVDFDTVKCLICKRITILSF